MEASFHTRVIAGTPRREDAGRRLDEYLAGRFTYRSLAMWQERLTAGEIFRNDLPADGSELLAFGDRIEWRPGDLEEPVVDLHYTLLYQDEELLVVNKSGDLPTHPGGPFFRHTLWHRLCCDFGEIFPVNRLDRETSGIILIARNKIAAAKLAKQLPQFEKSYLAWVFGSFPQTHAAAGWLSQDPHSTVRKKQRFHTDDTVAEKISARTIFQKIAEKAGKSLVLAQPETGRMHQIRATLCSLGYPLLGDKLYGVDDTLFLKIRDNALTASDFQRLGMPRQALHAWRLRFPHPATGEFIECTAPYPDDFPEPEFIKHGLK